MSSLRAKLTKGAKAYAPRVLVSLLLAGGFAWMLHKSGLPVWPQTFAIESTPTAALFVTIPHGKGLVSARVPLSAFALYTALFSLIIAARTFRWWFLLRPIRHVPMRTMAGVGLVGIGAILLAPLRTGEIVRPFLLADRSEFSFAQAAGTVGAERVLDGLALTSLLFAGLLTSTPLSPLPDHLGDLPLPVAAIPSAAYSVLALFTSAFVAMVVFFRWRNFARKTLEKIVSPFSTKAANWLADKLFGVAEGLSFLPSRTHLAGFVSVTVAYWFTTVLAAWVLLQGCGLQATFSHAAVLIGVLGIGLLLPSGPGFFGSFQFSCFCALALFFPIENVVEPGGVFVFLFYVVQVVITLLGTLLGFGLLASSPSLQTNAAELCKKLGPQQNAVCHCRHALATTGWPVECSPCCWSHRGGAWLAERSQCQSVVR